MAAIVSILFLICACVIGIGSFFVAGGLGLALCVWSVVAIPAGIYCVSITLPR